ncbi:MAG: hypothetical protein RLY97_949 [Pseudomonadota bacterium]|jgi:uncharacterized protein YbaA (DUF1428 family)
MNYVDGYLIPVKTARKQDYIDAAAAAAPLFIEHGAIRVVENWADDLTHGKVTDFFMAVKAEEDESVVFSWVEWPNKEARDAGNAALMADPRFAALMPDGVMIGPRMIFGGFSNLVDRGI